MYSNTDIKNSSKKIERTCSISSVILCFRIEPILSMCARECLRIMYYVYGNSIQSNALPIIEWQYEGAEKIKKYYV